MPDSSRLDRARGALLGQAIGDALGAPLEGLTPQQIKRQYDQVVDFVDGFQAWKKKTISQMQTESGNRAEFRDILSDSLLQELTIRK